MLLQVNAFGGLDFRVLTGPGANPIHETGKANANAIARLCKRLPGVGLTSSPLPSHGFIRQ